MNSHYQSLPENEFREHFRTKLSAQLRSELCIALNLNDEERKQAESNADALCDILKAKGLADNAANIIHLRDVLQIYSVDFPDLCSLAAFTTNFIKANAHRHHDPNHEHHWKPFHRAFEPLTSDQIEWVRRKLYSTPATTMFYTPEQVKRYSDKVRKSNHEEPAYAPLVKEECPCLLPNPDAAGEVAKRIHGKPARWDPKVSLDITYMNLNVRPELIKLFEQACRDWESICRVRFREVQAGHLALFSVWESDMQDVHLPDRMALCFLPSQPKEERILKINAQLFNYVTKNAKWDAVGMLRHEVGHILGFGHEFVKLDEWKNHVKITELQNEEIHQNRKELAPFVPEDKSSIMNYPSYGGSVMFRFSETDKLLAKAYYGSPEGMFENCL